MVCVPGRHRMRRRLRGAGAIAAVMALLIVGAGSWYGYQRFLEPACTGETRLTMAAAPEIAPAIQAAATDWADEGGSVDGTCVAVQVTAPDVADVAATIAARHGVSLAGVGQASGAAVVPDVWVPDSSMWLVRLSAAASGFAPDNRRSLARSPVVVAMPEPVAASVGWPEKKLGWKDLLQKITTGTDLRTGIVEPTRDAAGLSGLLALSAAAGGAGPDAQKITAGALRALATGRSALRQDLLARFPRSADPASIATSLGAAALSEEDVIQYNATKPPIQLAALYLNPPPISLDYPYAIMPGIDPAKAAAAAGFFDVLQDAAFRDRLGAQALRAPDGTWGAGFAAPKGAPSPAGSAAPTAPSSGGGKAAGVLNPEIVDRVLSTWTAVTLPSRMLAVVDISGSMGAKVPTAGGATRQQVTIAAAEKGLALFDDNWAVGLWTFSTDLDGDKDYRELVPIGPLSSQRSRLLAASRSIRPKPGGRTGLYDTVLAAYKAVQEDWEPGRVNSVVLLTDGQNDNASGLTQQQLLAALKKAVDPKRPIQVVIVGISSEVSQPELESITKVTGGGVFVTEDPAKIGDIFLKAIALRPVAR
jgi:Ca-activated chloride channel homolog